VREYQPYAVDTEEQEEFLEYYFKYLLQKKGLRDAKSSVLKSLAQMK
jgi:hypothetical protein